MLKTYRVLSGTHSEPGKVIYKAGQTFQSYADLDTMFPGKFETVGAGTAPTAPPVAPTTASVATKAPKPTKTPNPNPEPLAGVTKPAGREVTMHFPEAVEQQFRVFKQADGRYNVYDSENMAKPVNPEPLAKPEIDATIRSTLMGG